MFFEGREMHRDWPLEIAISHDGDGVARPTDRVYLFFGPAKEQGFVLSRADWTRAIANPILNPPTGVTRVQHDGTD